MIDTPDPVDAAAILSRFGLGDGDMIGTGGEARVYRLDGERVLRIPRGSPFDPDAVARVNTVLDPIRSELPYQVPRILDIDRGGAYSIEAMLPGKAVTDRLPDLEADERRRLWAHYADALRAQARIPAEDGPYRHLIAPRFSAATWAEFIFKCIEESAERNRTYIERDVAPVDKVLVKAGALAAQLTEPPGRQLVHGDFFGGNVLVDNDLKVSAVLDFSTWTVAGDPSLDAASAYLPLEQVDIFTKEDAVALRAELYDDTDTDAEAALACYRAYFAVTLLEPDGAKSPYPLLYQWSLDNLHRLMRDELSGF